MGGFWLSYSCEMNFHGWQGNLLAHGMEVEIFICLRDLSGSFKGANLEFGDLDNIEQIYSQMEAKKQHRWWLARKERLARGKTQST